MSAHRRVKSKDEELAYRDDSFRPRTHHIAAPVATRSWLWRKRRIFVIIGGLVLLWFFLGNILGDGDSDDDSFGSLLDSRRSIRGADDARLPSGAPPRTDAVIDQEQRLHYYEGRIKFYNLARSLHAISKTRGTSSDNRNVLFAASSLRSAANLLPLACAMGKWDRSFVHFAILGRDPMPIDEIMDINGISDEACHLFLHDSRSDFSEYSTDKRAEVSVTGAMKHINDFMHPQAIIVDDASVEDAFFISAMRKKAKDIRRALIEIPEGKYMDFLWMTKLDSGSLGSWHLPTIDILIHAPRQSSGGLLRTIKSIKDADYTGLKPPRLTIELPPDIDTFAKRYLEGLRWPPDDDASPLKTNTLALRHRIPSSQVPSEEVSIRFVESFYPTHTDDNHVLVLSSQTELSPLYYQYLYYATLEYRYSSFGAADVEDLLGIALDVPNTIIDGKTTLEAPKVSQMISKRYTENHQLDQSAPVPFLYGAPTSTASLIFGDKWAVLHNFLKFRLAANHAGKAEKTQRLVTETEPVWMEYFLELIRAKGWFTLHPASSFLTLHNELARVPEEYRGPSKEDRKPEEESSDTETLADEPFLTGPDPVALPKHDEQDGGETHAPLHDILPFEGDLPELPHLPYIDHEGKVGDLEDPKVTRMLYASHFRRHVGGCSVEDSDRARVVPFLTAEELFCLPDMEVLFGDDDDDDEGSEEAEAIVDATEPSSGDAKTEDVGPDEQGDREEKSDGAEQDANPPDHEEAAPNR